MRKVSVHSKYAALVGGALAGAVILSAPGTAHANFIITSDRYASGADDVVVFRALNDGLGDQAGTTLLQSANVTLQSVGQPLIFNFQDVDGDGQTDANVGGVGFTFPSSSLATMPTGSFVRVGSASAFYIASSTPQAYTDPTGTPLGNNPVSDYTGINQFNVQGTNPGGGVEADVTPAAFAVAVVPTGTEVDLTGQLAAEAGGIENVSSSNVPEPASMSLVLAAGSFLLLGRRRRVTLAGA